MTDSIDNRSIAVLRKRMPYTDRRSLSQAWFSALHLAQIGPARGLPARRASDSSFVAPGPRAASAPAVAQRPVPLASRSAGTKPERAAARDAEPRRTSDARVSPSDKAAFERARSYPPFSTSLTVGVDGTRIKLLVRREGSTLHVVALCSPQNADLVRRALACADTFLRRSGESVRASVQTL